MNPNLVPTPAQAILRVTALLEHERWAVSKTDEALTALQLGLRLTLRQRATPRVAHGHVAVQMHLLAPNMRPQQVTTDLDSFWRETYPEVRKTLRGRYPKHAWPEDPLGGG